MAILGFKNDGAGFTRGYNSTLPQRLVYDASFTLAYVAGHVVTEVGFWLATPPASSATITVGIYDISGGRVGAPLIYSKQLTATSGSTPEAYVTVTGLSDSISGLSGGETLAFAVTHGNSSDPWEGRRGSASTSLGPTSSTLNDPWSESSTSGAEGADGYIVVEDAGPQLTITDPIIPGTTTTFSSSGNVDPWTGVRITDTEGNVKELTLASQTSVSAPAVGDLAYALFGDVTLEVYNATESATSTIAFNPPAGFNQIALEAGFATDQESFLYQYGGTPAVPDQMAYDPIASDTAEILTLQTNGYWTATGYGEWTIYGIDATDGEMQSFPFVWDAPAIPGGSGKMTRRNLTRRTLTRRSLTARP